MAVFLNSSLSVLIIYFIFLLMTLSIPILVIISLIYLIKYFKNKTD